MDGNAGAHRRATEVRIDAPCRFRISVRLQVGALAAAQPGSGELHLFRRLPPCHARHYGMPDLLPRRNQRFPARRAAENSSVSKAGRSTQAHDSKASITVSVAIEFQWVGRAASEPVSRIRGSGEPMAIVHDGSCRELLDWLLGGVVVPDVDDNHTERSSIP